MLSRLLLLLVVSTSMMRIAEAVECSAIFTDGLQNNNNSGSITFNNKAQLKNSFDNVLDSKNNIIDNSGSSLNSCESGACTSSGDSAESISYNNFPNGNNITVLYQQTLALAPGNYNNLTANSEAALELSSGDYTFKGNFSLGNLNKVSITDGGIVRIFVKGSVQINSETEININGNSANLLLYFDTNVQILSSSKISAFIYNKKDVTLNSFSEVTGSISAKNITLGSEATVTFDNNGSDFGDFCEGSIISIPILDYRFDECSYTGAPGEVIDNAGSFNADTNNIPSPIDNAVINKSIDLSNDDTSDWLNVPKGAVDGLDDFTISTWIKTGVSKSQQEVFHALGNNSSDDELEIYLSGSSNVYVKLKDDSDTLSNNVTLTDGQWHHIVVTRIEEDICLYVDGAAKDCSDNYDDGNLSVPNDNSVVIGQEQDSIGGDFDDSQSFEGQLDEFKIYDTKLSDTVISNLYQNEAAAKNYDGTTRDAVDCNLIELVAGRVTLNNTTDNPAFTHVCFDEPFSEVPVVFSLPTTASNAERLTLRIRNVTVNGFDIAQVESPEKANPNSPDGNLPQTVDFLAIVKGDYDLDGGAKMRVSTLDTTTFQAKHINGAGWETISTIGLGFSQSPAIIASIQTMNNEPNNSNLTGPFPISEPFLATAVRNVNNNSFQMALERGETNSGTITNNETIGYIAISSDSQGGLTSDISYESFRTNDVIQGVNSCHEFDFDSSYTSNPIVIASQNKRDGIDGGWLKRCSISMSDVGFSIVEDRDGDNDTNHTTERAGVLALGGTFKDYTNSCPSAVDHFEIGHDGQGLTCQPENITVKACANSSCSLLNNDATDVQLSINGTFDKTITIVGGTTNTNFSYTNAGTAILSLDQTYECKNGTSTSCDVVFSDTGFRFYENTETNPIPTQVSAKPSNTLKIQAIEKNPDTGACQATFIDTTTIEMAATCVDPIACAGSQVAINNLITTGDITTLDKNSVLSYSSVNLDFSDNTVNSAEFIFTYPDAGKVQLHARYNIPDENGDPSGNYMLGSSNEFVVRPFGFFINVVDNPKAQSANQPNSVFKKAGVEFTTSLTAVQWQAEDDIDEDGVPDTSADLIDNSTTVNFGNETTPETAIITDSLYLPNLGVEGKLTNVDFTDFNDGIATNGVINNKSMTYDEVGIVNFTANLTSGAYLGASDVIGVEPYVGRFIPDHFELSTGFDGSIISVCDIDSPSSEMTFAYTGQMSSIDDTKGALQYESALQPELLITAKSSICPDDECTTTQNYTGDFIKFSAEDVEYIIPLEDATLNKVGSLGDTIKLLANLSEGTLPEEANGVITYAFNVNDNFVYLHEQNAEISPFPSLIELGISKIKDSDDVLAIDSDDDTDNNRLWVLKPTSKEIRFGRVQLENSYGPETSDLPQPLSVNYFKEGQYVLSEDDNCTRYDSSKLTIIDISLINFSSVPPLPDITSVTDKFINETPPGETRAIELIAPGTGNTGQVCVSYDIYPWLQYEWAIDEDNLQCPFVKADVDGLFNDNPRAVATFGIYRGNDRIIYQREISR